MGKKKKFIDKKKSATFQLLARDSSDPNNDGAPGSDRVFIRVDNNPVSINSLDDDNNHYGDNDSSIPNDNDSIYADAPGDDDDGGNDYARVFGSSARLAAYEEAPLPEHVRKEILELGFPDDGYNYLTHLREIKNTGGGSVFYHNPKFRVDELPRDVKAYDASRVQISEAKADHGQKSIYSVASKTVNVRVQRAVDPEVAALLDDSDLSRFGSDVEDLEEDFVVRANMPEGGDRSENVIESAHEASSSGNQEIADEVRNQQVEEKPRVRRLLDEQFDLLELKEYGTDDDDDDDAVDESDSVIPEEEAAYLADKMKNVFNDQTEDLELDEKYIVPAELLHNNGRPKSKESVDTATDIIRCCYEYAERYENGSEDDKVIVEESSGDELEQWDCETIITTYSNLDNHPAKIGAPEIARKKKLAETVAGALSSKSQLITLRGKEKIPVEFLPNSKKAGIEKVKEGASGLKNGQVKKQRGQETKEEKKEQMVPVTMCVSVLHARLLMSARVLTTKQCMKVICCLWCTRIYKHKLHGKVFKQIGCMLEVVIDDSSCFYFFACASFNYGPCNYLMIFTCFHAALEEERQEARPVKKEMKGLY